METALRASAPTQHTARIVASCSSKASTSYASSLSKYRLTSQTQQQRARLSPCQAAADASGGDEPEFKKWTLSNLLSRKKNNGKGEGSDKPNPIPRKKSDWEEDWEADWDPQAGLSQEQIEMEEYEAYRALRRPSNGDAPRDKWITPLLDFQAIAEAFDPDQERTEQSLQDEALTNKEVRIPADQQGAVSHSSYSIHRLQGAYVCTGAAWGALPALAQHQGLAPQRSAPAASVPVA